MKFFTAIRIFLSNLRTLFILSMDEEITTLHDISRITYEERKRIKEKHDQLDLCLFQELEYIEDKIILIWEKIDEDGRVDSLNR